MPKMLAVHSMGVLPIDLSFELMLNNVCFFLSLFCNLIVIDFGTVFNALINETIIKRNL